MRTICRGLARSCSLFVELAAEFLSQGIEGQALLLPQEDHLISAMNIKLCLLPRFVPPATPCMSDGSQRFKRDTRIISSLMTCDWNQHLDLKKTKMEAVMMFSKKTLGF